MTKKWSDEEEIFLRENYISMTFEKLSLKLGRGKRTIQDKAQKLNICKRKLKKWSQEEIEELKKIYPTHGIAETCKILERSLDSVTQKCGQLKINKCHQWQKLDKNYVIHNYTVNNKSVNDIAAELGANFWDICIILNKNDIPKQKKEPKRGQKHHNWKGFGEISKSQWNDIVRCAKDRNIIFDIGIDYIWELFLQQNRKCALSGVKLKFSIYVGKYWKETTASLDRIDSGKGYTQNNVQWVHKVVNIIKWQLPQDEFIDWCGKIYNYKG